MSPNEASTSDQTPRQPEPAVQEVPGGSSPVWFPPNTTTFHEELGMLFRQGSSGPVLVQWEENVPTEVPPRPLYMEG
ncbi:hypothetical protein SCP_0211210 [Sparassis crispa]|uniref:Uncharacterized protein n=1 Tax=Sparassis crispa TaxID=139825 RepID=A0A401GCL5_9APHY|nr:hypothetical protein SCP_0211210 [Sparassis crispa]GBE79919.1 hypothetical protein SCP_0211210 [Sparassis crispa]